MKSVGHRTVVGKVIRFPWPESWRRSILDAHPDRLEFAPDRCGAVILRPGWPTIWKRGNTRSELSELPDARMCCGSAGTCDLDRPEIAGSLGEKKAHAVIATGDWLSHPTARASGKTGFPDPSPSHDASAAKCLRQGSLKLREPHAGQAFWACED